MATLPVGSGIDWLVAAGASAEQMQEITEKERREKEVADLYEKEMGYNPVNWWNDKNLKALLLFLCSKTEDEIKTFAAWSRKKYSTFNPAKARQFPRMVIDLWPQAFLENEQLSWVEQAQKEREHGYPD